MSEQNIRQYLFDNPDSDTTDSRILKVLQIITAGAPEVFVRFQADIMEKGLQQLNKTAPGTTTRGGDAGSRAHFNTVC